MGLGHLGQTGEIVTDHVMVVFRFVPELVPIHLLMIIVKTKSVRTTENINHKNVTPTVVHVS